MMKKDPSTKLLFISLIILKSILILNAVLFIFLLMDEKDQNPVSCAQEIQEDFKDKLKFCSEGAGVGVVCSADGKYVYVAGNLGVIFSDDYGKTASWKKIVKGKY